MAEGNLTQVEAAERFSLVSDVKYNFSLKLEAGAPSYEGDIHISFQLSSAPLKELFLDYTGKTLHEVLINNAKTEVDFKQDKARIYLPVTSLRSNQKNTIQIKYTNNYDHEGEGFHQFIDPQDNQEYLYTNFEPFHAHRLFPCFDQPDIKATYHVTVEAPSNWEVVSNYPIVKSTSQGNKNVIEYLETPKFSTYLFAIIAGPYAIFSDSYEDSHVKVPLRIICRKTLVPFIKDDLEELFTITKQGMKFYGDFFSFPYPFAKYDQIWVPEFNQGAMENVGCVTFSEHYIFKEKPTEPQRCGRADTILHEMAHMWFGNLVTMKWWDGLWLNESFATYMAALTVSKATRFGDLSWQTFNSGMKKWAEREDQLSTTHPIQGTVVDTVATFLNFDGITYGKGASVLKQLVAVVSEQGFQASMAHYFKKHAWGNTVIHDFLEALEVGYASVSSQTLDLKKWAEYWLETAGINTLLPIIHSENGVISHFEIQQSAPSNVPTLRPHTVEIGIFQQKENHVTKLHSVFAQVLPQEKTEIPQLKGVKVGDFVFINFNDHAFAKTLLDSQSLQFVLANLEKIDHTLMRQLLWSTLFHMVRDHKLRATEFIHLVRSKLPFEKDVKLVQSILFSTRSAIQNYLPDDIYIKEADTFFQFALEQLKQSTVPDLQITWANTCIQVAVNPKTIQVLLDMIDKGTGVQGFELDQAMRWSLVQKQFAFSIAGAEERLQKEKEKDPSDRGQRSIETALASIPTAENKAKIYDRILNDKTSSNHTISAVMSGFRWHHQRELLEPYTDKFFEQVRSIYKERSKEYATSFGYYLFPFNPDDDKITNRTKQLLASLDENEEKVLVRFLKEELDDIARCRGCRDLERQAKL